MIPNLFKVVGPWLVGSGAGELRYILRKDIILGFELSIL